MCHFPQNSLQLAMIAFPNSPSKWDVLSFTYPPPPPPHTHTHLLHLLLEALVAEERAVMLVDWSLVSMSTVLATFSLAPTRSRGMSWLGCVSLWHTRQTPTTVTDTHKPLVTDPHTHQLQWLTHTSYSEAHTPATVTDTHKPLEWLTHTPATVTNTHS